MRVVANDNMLPDRRQVAMQFFQACLKKFKLQGIVDRPGAVMQINQQIRGEKGAFMSREMVCAEWIDLAEKIDIGRGRNAFRDQRPATAGKMMDRPKRLGRLDGNV